MKKADYDPMRDFAPIAIASTTSWLLAISPSLPVKTMAEFVAYTKANPGKVTLAYTQGTAAVLVGERFKQSVRRRDHRNPLQGRRGRDAGFPRRAHPDADPDAVDHACR